MTAASSGRRTLRDVAIVAQVAREVYHGHAALADLAFDGVAVRERGDEAGAGGGGHPDKVQSA